MTPQEVVFILVAIATGASAVATVTSRNLVHAALFLAATLAGIGGVFLVLRADFVAWVQIVVYVGAIAVLFLFGLMLTRAPIGREALDSQNRGLGLVVSASMFGVLTTLIVQAFGDVRAELTTSPNIEAIGEAIFSVWVLPFELLSMLLLAGLVGAVLLSRRESGESGTESEVTPIRLSEPPSNELEAGATPSTELERVTGGQQ
ncbi:MAG: NADH-quinone oxidoreductase subunit J [Actinomycetes bacterium]